VPSKEEADIYISRR